MFGYGVRRIPLNSEKTFWCRVNIAGPLLAVWLVVSVLFWHMAALIVGETVELTGVAFGVGEIVVSICDLAIRSRKLSELGLWRFFSSECGANVEDVPGWILALAGAASGFAFAMGFLSG